MSQRTVIQDVEAAWEFLRNIPPWECTRGKALFTGGAVRNLRCEEEGRSFSADVQAQQLFTVSVFHAGEGWDATCNCKKQFGCEHAYAVLTALLAGREALPSGEGAPNPRSMLEKRLVEKLPRKLTRDERRILTNLQELYLRCRTKGHLDSWDLTPFGYTNFNREWGRLDLWPAFPSNDYEFWLYLAHALKERNITIAPFLEVVTELDPVRDALSQVKRRKEISRWQQQLRLANNGGFETRPSNPVDFRLVLTPKMAYLESKSGEAPFKRLKVNQVRRFNDEYSAGTLEIVPEAAPLWHSYAQTQSYNWRYEREIKFTDQESKRLLNPLLRLPTLRERIVTESGEPFSWLPEPVRWNLVPAATETDDYQVQLVRPDGSVLEPIWLTLPGRPTLYVTPEGIYTGPRPLEVCLEAGKTNSIPAPALETADGLNVLLRLGLDLPPRLQERVQRVTLKPRIYCELGPTYPGSHDSESIFVRVLAETADDFGQEILTNEGWRPDLTASPRKVKTKAGTIVLYERNAMDLFPSALDPLGLKWDHYRQRWHIRLTKNLPQKFAEWLESLPKELEVFLDRELATLTKEPSQATVKLDCTESGVDWFDLKVVLDVSDTELTPGELKALLNAHGRFVRLGKKGWRRLHFNLSAEEDERLARLGLSATDFTSEPQRLHALQLADKAAAPLLPEAQAEHIQRRIGELKTRVTPPVPESVRAQLRPYQIEGFHFLAYLTVNHFGGILADDMGLGKTLQTLTWLAWLRADSEQPKKPSLVVCPKSVMDTWRGEAQRFTPELRVKLWQGTDGRTLAEALADTDLLVMNYAQLRGLGQSILTVEWLTAILDEGQYIKNPESQTARAARALKADYRLALSGTPIENRLLDLWSLMAFAMPGVLGNRAYFLKRFDGTGDTLARRRLTARVRPFLLRRTKSQVATDLPDRTEEDLYCELEGQQKVLYQAEFKRAQQMLLNVQTRKELNEFRFHFLTSLLRLRQICCHPGLYLEQAKNTESAKLNAFKELVEPLMQEGHKVLVFSQFVSMLEILREVVEEKEWPYFYLAGDTENRGALVEQFQSAPGPALFLISLKAGGFGLNLTAASYVVLFDPWWNPAVESQAIDRTHRIGQTSKVIAYRLLTKGSIEEKIRALQRAKSALVADVLGEDSFAGSLTLEDLKFIFSDEPGETKAGEQENAEPANPASQSPSTPDPASDGAPPELR